MTIDRYAGLTRPIQEYRYIEKMDKAGVLERIGGQA